MPNKGYGTYKTPIDVKRNRLLTRAIKTETCWYWRDTFYPNGYGRIYLDAGEAYAHRVSYELFNGPIPKGISVLHTCFNKACINPQHLYLGTHKDNADDTDYREVRRKRLVLTQDKIDYILRVKDELPRSTIAKTLEVSLSTVDRVIQRVYSAYLLEE